MRFQKLSIILAATALLVSACTAPAELPNTGGELSPTIPALATDVAPVIATNVAPLQTDVPLVVAAAQDWLAAQTGIDVTQLELVSFEQTEWTDSCLGLGGPAESCALVMVPGWRAVFRSAGTTYEVRTDETGTGMRMTEIP